MAHLLIVELPGGNDTDLIQAAVARGDTFTFLTADLGFYMRQPAVAQMLSHAHACLDMPGFDAALVQQHVLDAHAQHPFDAILCLLDIRLVETAHLAQSLHLKYLNPESAVLLRDKFNVRSRLKACGIAQPNFALATSNEELQQAVDDMGLPVLIKPADGYGSQNVVVLQTELDLDPFLSPLQDMLTSRADYGLGVKANDRLLVEQYMPGLVIGCDTLTQNGQHQLLGINEKLFFEPPSFAIQGGCFTPNHGQFKPIEDYVFALLDAVGFDWGATHIELMLSKDGLQLIEINPRLVGAKIPRLMGYALHRAIHSDLIDLHLGRPLTPYEQTGDVAVTRWIVSDKSGVLDRVECPSASDPRISAVEILKQPGDHIRQPMDNADRIGYVMTCAPSRSEAEHLAAQFVAQSQICFA
jgi:biotin carboxylase